MDMRPGLFLLSLVLCALPVHADWVTFPAAPAQALIHDSDQDVSHVLSPVRGFVTRPASPGPHPAVVLLPSCVGQRAFHQSWARALSERGFLALVIDHYFLYDLGRKCDLTEPQARADLLHMRLLHTLGAVAYLETRTDVDTGRLAVMGWSDAPVGLLQGRGGSVRVRDDVFRAGVIVTPTACDGRFTEATLIVEADDPESACRRPDAANVRIYRDTSAGFDDPRKADQGIYNRLAHAEAIADVAAFLADRLKSGTPRSPTVTFKPPEPIEGEWGVDPYRPGADLPPAGASAFDYAFAGESQAHGHDVPWPFTALLQRLERLAGGSFLDTTLIPLGRSLQREAAAPDYFESPRIVVAVTSDPAPGQGAAGIPLGDRLFLGYQPVAGVIEVISYNALANRFEFQVVTNYRAGETPKVRYVRRALCTSCHQNAAPIFADAGWDETTANAQVAERLQALGARWHGIATERDNRAVSAIDTATDDANVLPVLQRLWREGCSSQVAAEARTCRAGALLAMIQYRLSVGAGFSRSAGLYRHGYLATLSRNWNKRWPKGLLIPDANLPNRSPLMSASPSRVPVALDPLRRRAPRETWQVQSTRDLERMVRGLSRYLPDDAITVMDGRLRRRWGGELDSLPLVCRLLRRGVRGQRQQLQFDCAGDSRGAQPVELSGRLRIETRGSVGGELKWLALNGGSFTRLSVSGRWRVEGDANTVDLRFDGHYGRRVRAPEGNTLQGLSLSWDERDFEATRANGGGVLDIALDFDPVTRLLERAAQSGGGPLDGQWFDGIALARSVARQLGGSLPRLAKRREAPPAVLDEQISDDLDIDVALEHRGGLGTFKRFCGACHGADSVSPPGFLHGKGEQLLQQVTHCAPRIFYRLSMWNRPVAQQGVPPMPPLQGLVVAGVDSHRWRTSESRERLTRYAAELASGSEADASALLQIDYHRLRQCLPGDAAIAASGSS